jgi:chemotaxis protein MotB
VENSEQTTDLERFVQPMKGRLVASANTPLKEVQAELEKVLAPEIQRRVVEVKPHKEGLVISLREIGFYGSGSAELRASSRNALDRLAAVLEYRKESLRIEGHTDNVPIHNRAFASNWELSTTRASELIRVFVTQYQMDPSRLSAAGYAEFHPISPNETAEGRARNRRVDIVVLNPPRVEQFGASSELSR